jgi:hypothetical protein
MAIDAINMLRYKARLSLLPGRVAALFSGLAACVRYAKLRKPVSAEAYGLYRTLPAHKPEPFSGTAPAVAA